MQNHPPLEISCTKCRAHYGISNTEESNLPRFCVFCAHDLTDTRDSLTEKSQLANTSSSTGHSVTLIKGHQPEGEPIVFTLGSYQILQTIGKGGMGEVFLAYDTTCGRRIALKRIRSDLIEHKQMHRRFLKEARVTSQLTHPSIIPIYTIHSQDDLAYYTMPFVEGRTLKEIFRKTRAQEKKGETLDHIGGSIPALIRIFLSTCQAVAYAHSKSVLHRDIKPENIIVGQFGEVLILDWGLAKLMRSDAVSETRLKEAFSDDLEESEQPDPHPLTQLTHLGKVVGTISYMAPERAIGNPANVQSDIYSLGVILYQILTLRHPFKRGTLKEFRETMHLETLMDPIEVAPYREVPRILSRIAMKCLAPIDNRYHTVQELIRDIENYIEGRSEWFQIAQLDIFNKSDWEFQENVLIAEHVAITRGTEVSDWVSLMISKSSFSENIKIEARVKLGENGHGIGVLLSVPEAAERSHVNDGYCLWLGSDQYRSTKLLRSTVEVFHAGDIFLERQKWYTMRIEKMENNIYLYLNNILQFSYISHLPLVGTHLGLLSRDADFVIQDLNVFVGSQNVMVNCLAVPDAFLAHKDYTAALSEYRRIGYSFPGRAEGREAMFRAGITLLEQARSAAPSPLTETLFDQALNEFEKLHGTPGAVLEYLGKALVYQTLHDYDEELKCYELACRRYSRHPLLPILREQIVYRMHDVSRYHRQTTYKFILLVVRHLPTVTQTNNVKQLIHSLKKHWEPLPFIEDEPASFESDTFSNASFAIVLAFWLSKPYVLNEILEELLRSPSPVSLICNACYCLIELGATYNVYPLLAKIKKKPPENLRLHLEPLSILFLAKTGDWKKLICLPWDFHKERMLLFFMNHALDEHNTTMIHQIVDHLKGKTAGFSPYFSLQLDCIAIWSHLLERQWDHAGALLQKYPLEQINEENSLLHFLYGCWLYVTEGKEIAQIHLAGVLDIPYPRTWTLFSHYYTLPFDPHSGWYQKAFLWEKRQFLRQMSLFSHCTGDTRATLHYQQLANQQRIIENPTASTSMS